MSSVRVFTIGFTKKSAEQFFTLIRDAGAKRVADIRLNNTSQLAGFAKRDDLEFFLREMLGVGYVHVPELAPTQDLIDRLKKQKRPWDEFARDYLALIEDRRVAKTLSREVIHESCLLCSEHEPEHCHRGLVADYLRSRWGDVEITHLM